MLLCPNCTEKLEKPIKYGEGAWNCPDCGEDWFIINIPQPKVSYGHEKKKPLQKKKRLKPKKGGLLKYWP